MQTVYLDYSGSALVPEKCPVIASEVELLGHDWTTGSVVIRGKSLCRWVEEFCRGRGFACERLLSPMEALRAVCSEWTEEQAEWVWQEIRAGWSSTALPGDALAILEQLYPEGPWDRQTGRAHAARWLLWLSERAIPAHHLPLIKVQAQRWETVADSTERDLYRIYTPDAATALLEQWLGMAPVSPMFEPGSFPVDLPPAWRDRVERAWRERTACEGARFLRELTAHPLSEQMQAIASRICYDYYLTHPQEITPAALATLSGRISESQLQELLKRQPPPEPADLPGSPDDVMAWYESYLLYRRWQVSCGGDHAAAVVARCAHQFAMWCLDFYPRALAGGNGQEYLAITMGQALRESRRDWVTLWVVLDGLLYSDAIRLEQLLSVERALTGKRQTVLAPLPTLTRFSKNAIMNGVPADTAGEESPKPVFEGAIPLSWHGDNTERVRAAKRGDVYVLSLMQPDRTYHSTSTPAMLHQQVEEALSTIVRSILEMMKAFPEEVPLRVCISTDHGRMLSIGERRLPVPEGMRAEGRAAWGESRRSFPAAGYVVDETEGLVYLERHRFGLPCDCAVPLGPDLFVRSDGSTGSEAFAHGGLYPEEVLIPWLEYVRVPAFPQIRGAVRGRVRKGQKSMLTIQLINPSNESVTALAVDIREVDQHRFHFPFEATLPPLETLTRDVELPEWSGPAQVKHWKAIATLRTAYNGLFTVDLENQIDVLVFQEREIEDSELWTLG